MRSFPVLVVSGLVLLCSACGASGGASSLPCEGAPVGQPQLQGAFAVFVPGETAVVTPLARLPPMGCEGRRVPDSVRVEVVDPHNRPVAAHATLEDGQRARVEFPVSEVGAYHVRATFEPVGGVVQMDVPVAEDRSGATQVVLPRACRLLDRTAAGAWVCDRLVLREGTVVQTFPGDTTVVSGNRVWSVDSRRGVSVFEDTGAGPLELLAQAEGLFPQDVPFYDVVAGEDRLVAHVDSSLHAVFLAPEGGLSVRSSPVPSWTGQVPLLLVDGAVVAVAREDVMQGSGLPEHVQVCTWQLSPGAAPAPAGACTMVPGTLLGYEARGLWMQEPPVDGFVSPVMRFHRLQGGSVLAGAAGPLASSGAGLFPAASTLLRWGDAEQGWTVPRHTDTGVVLERYPPVRSAAGADLASHAREGFTWVGDILGGTTTVFLR